MAMGRIATPVAESPQAQSIQSLRSRTCLAAAAAILWMACDTVFLEFQDRSQFPIKESSDA